MVTGHISLYPDNASCDDADGPNGAGVGLMQNSAAAWP